MTEIYNCPSAPKEWWDEESYIFGIVGGTANARQVLYTKTLVSFTKDEIEESAKPATAEEIYRVSATCRDTCKHWAGRCTLIDRVLDVKKPAPGKIPPCRLRHSCRWFEQHGVKACHVCDQVASGSGNPNTDKTYF